MLKALLLLFVFQTFCSQVVWGQHDSSAYRRNVKSEIPANKLYKTHPGWEIPVSLAFIGAASLGYKEMDKIASLTAEQALALNPASINSFDRPAAYYDPAKFSDYALKSDVLMTFVVASPIFLLLDKKIKRDWADMISMLLMAQAIDNTLLFSGFLSVRRPRPVAFNPAVPIDEKTGVGKTNSFFSGHVSWTATSTFFIAKLYTDYHQIKGIKRILIYTGAALPPALVGYYRMHAGRHFESDALVGLTTGALCGILVPAIHKVKKKNIDLGIRPFSMLGSSGLTLTHTIKYTIGKASKSKNAAAQ